MNSKKMLTMALLWLQMLSYTYGTVVPEPLLQLLFNSSSDTQVSTGTEYITALPSGPAQITNLGATSVSGLDDDGAFDNTVANGMADSDPATGTGALYFGDVPQVDGLSHFTVSLWFKTDEGMTLDDGGGRLIDNGRDWLIFSDDPSRLRLEVALEGASSGLDNFPDQSDWVFIAITFDEAADTVIYYRGTKIQTTTEIVTRTDYDQVMPGRSNPLIVGNNEDLSRAFDGYIDNVRVWNDVLDADQLEVVRLSDLAGLGSVNSATLAEHTDAEAELSLAQSTPYTVEVDVVRGNLENILDADVYRIYHDGSSDVLLRLQSIDNSSSDTGRLYLFNEYGHLVACADSTGEINQSPTELPAGVYFMAVAASTLVPSSETGVMVDFDESGNYTPNLHALSPLEEWTVNSFSGDSYVYQVLLDGFDSAPIVPDLEVTQVGVWEDDFLVYFTGTPGQTYELWHACGEDGWTNLSQTSLLSSVGLFVLDTATTSCSMFQVREQVVE